ncbi:MAG TPA: hypothetical protein VIJ07_16720, partial [Dermatophilaceae bacterium]
KPSSTAQHRHPLDPPTEPKLQRSWHTHLASKRAPARLIPGLREHPGFDVTYLVFRHFISDSLAFAFLIST